MYEEDRASGKGYRGQRIEKAEGREWRAQRAEVEGKDKGAEDKR
jgi:hypothetical protein